MVVITVLVTVARLVAVCDSPIAGGLFTVVVSIKNT